MKNKSLIKTMGNLLFILSLGVFQIVFADGAKTIPKSKNALTTRAVKFYVIDSEGSPVAGVKINAFKKFYKFSPGILSDGHFVPNVDLHLKVYATEEINISITNDQGIAEIPLWMWSQKGLRISDLKVNYVAMTDSRISGFSSCDVDERQLELTAPAEPLVVNCVAYLVRRSEDAM